MPMLAEQELMVEIVRVAQPGQLSREMQRNRSRVQRSAPGRTMCLRRYATGLSVRDAVVQLQTALPHATGRKRISDVGSRADRRGRGGAVQWCAALVRVTMLASQRKGDGDATANWLYQLLALDPDTVEWESMNDC
jgi:hypothetical protein